MKKIVLLASLSLGIASCGGGGAKGPEITTPEFSCEYSLARSDEKLLNSGRELTLKGQDLQKLLQHSEKCLSNE